MKSFEVEIPLIHHVIRSGFGNEFVEDIHVVPLPVGDLDERRDVSPQIQKGVEFDGGLPFAESRPREKGKTQVDRCGVEGVHRLSSSTTKGSLTYRFLAVRIGTWAKSALMRQSRFSLALAKVVREIPPRMPM